MRIRRLCVVSLLLLFTLSPCRANRRDPLKRPAAFILKMTPDQWYDYFTAHGGFHYDALPRYGDCQHQVNLRRLRSCSRFTRRQWGQTSKELYDWLAYYWDWWQSVNGSGTWDFSPYQSARIACEQALARTLRDYRKPQRNRNRVRRQLVDALHDAQEELARSHPHYDSYGERFPVASAALKREMRRFQRFALTKSPNTMQAIADCLERISAARVE